MSSGREMKMRGCSSGCTQTGFGGTLKRRPARRRQGKRLAPLPGPRMRLAPLLRPGMRLAPLPGMRPAPLPRSEMML